MGSCGRGEQSMVVCFGTELTDALWNDGQESCESEDRMMMSCPNDEQFGFIVRVGLSSGCPLSQRLLCLSWQVLGGFWRLFF